MFVDREEELKTLEKCWSSKKFEFVVIYGRRRVGKTELIKEFIRDKDALYFLCSDRKPAHNLKKFSEKICEFTGLPPVKFGNFKDAFSALKPKTEKMVVAIDEFGYLVRRDPGILSDFQEIVDEELKRKNLILILCGSSVAMMETQVLGQRSPLYGRATKYMKVKPFDLNGLRKWFPRSSLETLIKIYSVTEGVAKYLEFFSGRDVEVEIKENFFNPASFLFGDAMRLLSDELRDYSTYIQVLEAIALGYNKVNEIANYALVQPKDVFFYLKVLSSLGIVERTVPIFSPRKAKRGSYEISDHYFNFWFRFISPFQAEVESGFLDAPIENFHKHFNAYLGKVFERISRYFLVKMNLLPFTPTKIGRWWHKDKEIDIVAASDATGEVLFGECKWRENVDADRTLSELKEKAKLVDWRRKERKEHFVIFAKSFKKKVDLPGLRLFDLSDLEELLGRK
ncbi:MAG: ATP-binding protein [Candidatus Hadarchaeum sp.]|uniref:ATP-binding protein n=1 Tax=Candidatus Hadarchaeum sp. TaxID=2883567 RepID=UPI00317A3126